MSLNRNRFFYDQYRLKRFGVIFIVALAGFVFVTALSAWSERKALIQAEEHAHDVLAYQSSNLVSHLNKFSLITALVAKRPDVISMFRLREAGNFKEHARQLASITAGLSGAKDFWFVDGKGDVFSSSEPELVGQNVKDQSYFEAGFQGRLGRTSEVDSTGFRSYVFASPVFVDNQVGGLVAVRVDLEIVEYVWALLTEPILATEANDRILLSNIEGWRLKYFTPMIKNKSLLSEKIGEYSREPLLEVDERQPFNAQDANREELVVGYLPKDSPVVGSSFLDQQAQIVELRDDFSFDEKRYLEVTTDVPLLQWKLHVLVDLSPVKQQGFITSIISSLMVVLIILLVWVLFERRRRLIERARDQRAFALRLERQVRDRTRELTATNTMLESEVVERRAAEQALRETQQDLMQAAKLAGIGQMSAALAHEYNQPLAAIRSYADNAMQLLALEKTDAASDNLTRITAITERMADLTRTLRSFAHKSDTVLEPVVLSSVMDEMIILLSPQAKKLGVELIVEPPQGDVVALAGHLRLSQVVINLVTNAMDAVKDRPEQWVRVSWFQSEGVAHIVVKDSGEGVPADLKDKIFTPFFTTKGVGVGLGLGLFIVYNMVKEFQGTIDVEQEVGCGGVFHMTLPLTEKESPSFYTSNNIANT